MPQPFDPIAEARRQWLAHGWAEAADGMALVTSVVRVHQVFMERVDAVLRPLDLTFARYEILRLLAFTRHGELAMSRLGSLLQVHATSVSSAVARLEAQGYATRARSSDDRRVILASITDAGRAVLETATDGLNLVFAELGERHPEAAGLTAQLGAFRPETSAG